MRVQIFSCCNVIKKDRLHCRSFLFVIWKCLAYHVGNIVKIITNLIVIHCITGLDAIYFIVNPS